MNLEGGTVHSGGPYDKMFTSHSELYCLERGCYRFIIYDSASDGICCHWLKGSGNYELYFDSFLVREGEEFTSEESSILFGSSCPSSTPSSTPPTISNEPSLVPSNDPSFAGSNQPSLVPSSNPSKQPSLVPSSQPSSVPSSSPSSSPSSTPSYNPSAQPTDSCQAGFFRNNMSSNSESNCQPCPKGKYQPEKNSDFCRECEAGTHQPNEGQTKCDPCTSGSFQVSRGQAECDVCRVGGYCAEGKIGTCDGGFKPCKVGTYNNRRGQDSETACLPCPAGE